MKFWLRWTADALAIFLALYLVDSVARGRFHVNGVGVVVILALLLGLLNSFVRPLRRMRSKPFVALLAVALTVLVNALILQVFVSTGAALSRRHFVWILAVAAFVSLLAGAINWLVGFKSSEKVRPSRARPSAREKTQSRPQRTRANRAPRART